MSSSSDLYDPASRDRKYAGDWAQYLLDLHDASATFDFCGGMFFQLSLSRALRQRLSIETRVGNGVGMGKDDSSSSSSDAAAVVEVFGKGCRRMRNIPKYEKSAEADDVRVFHGREVRQVKGAAGGMGFVLQLCASQDDPEGWSREEVADYDGWGHDSARPWRKVPQWESEHGDEGVFEKQFGAAAYGLHHRFFFHLDAQNHLWLSAEDGCEGRVRLAGTR